MKTSPEEVLRLLRRHSRLDIVAVSPTGRGESGSAYTATDANGQVSIVKVVPVSGASGDELRRDGEGVVRELDAVTSALRGRGYPAARLRESGAGDGIAYWVQELLPGAPFDALERTARLALIERLLPGLFRLNDAQAGLGTDGLRLASLLRRTMTVGGDGYCVHATLRDDPRARGLYPVVRAITDRYLPDIPDGADYVHYDFNTANILSDGAEVTGVVDMNPPVVSGDRAFDLATLLFYVYDHDGLRAALRGRLLALAGTGAAAVYLAHMVLRQVDWSLRHDQDAAGTELHLRLGRMVANDIGAAGWPGQATA
jgi:hypothetical protein